MVFLLWLHNTTTVCISVVFLFEKSHGNDQKHTDTQSKILVEFKIQLVVKTNCALVPHKQPLKTYYVGVISSVELAQNLTVEPII